MHTMATQCVQSHYFKAMANIFQDKRPLGSFEVEPGWKTRKPERRVCSSCIIRFIQSLTHP